MEDESPDMKTARRYRSSAAGCVGALLSWFMGWMGGRGSLGAFWHAPAQTAVIYLLPCGVAVAMITEEAAC